VYGDRRFTNALDQTRQKLEIAKQPMPLLGLKRGFGKLQVRRLAVSGGRGALLLLKRASRTRPGGRVRDDDAIPGLTLVRF